MEDHTGKRYGRLVGIRYTGTKTKGRSLIWEWKCDCGSLLYREPQNIKKGSTRSCGCFRSENTVNMRTKHGGVGTYEYGIWKSLRQRVLNTNNKKYKVYSKLLHDTSLIEDFEAFKQEMGPIPDDREKWTVDRIDNKLGYLRGNIRWATNQEQSRNKSLRADNKTGKAGVHVRKDSKGFSGYTASWIGMDGKKESKSYSINKYGEELAFLAACEYRDKQITLLSFCGVKYGHNHGESYDFTR